MIVYKKYGDSKANFKTLKVKVKMMSTGGAPVYTLNELITGKITHFLSFYHDIPCFLKVKLFSKRSINDFFSHSTNLIFKKKLVKSINTSITATTANALFAISW